MQNTEDITTLKTYLQKGIQLKKEGDLTSAIHNLSQALKIDPNHKPALNNLAEIYRSKKQLKKALTYYHQIAKLEPDNSTALAQLAVIMMRRGDIRGAIATYQKASILPQPPAFAYSGLAQALEKNGQLEEAITNYQKAIDINPKNLDLYVRLAEALEKNGQLEEAITNYQKAINFDSTIPGLNGSLLRCIHNSDKSTKDILNSKIMSAIENSKAIAFIKDQILSKLNIEYENHLILYQPKKNVGDTCKFLALIKPLCIQHNRKAIVFYPSFESPIIQANLFLDHLQPKYVISHFPIDIETEQTIKQLNSKDELSLAEIPVIVGIPRMMTNKPEVEKLTYITDESIYLAGKAASLGIKIELNDNTVGKPIIKDQSYENALNKFKKLNLPQGKSILIAPHSLTLDKSTGSNSRAVRFWQTMINGLIDQNIIPVINSRHRGEGLDYISKIFTNKQIRFADLSLDEVIPFVELCGAFAGIYSGLCTLVAFSSKKVIKLSVHAQQSGVNCFQKLSESRVIDNSLMNENFHIYHLSLNEMPEDHHIREEIVNLFVKRRPWRNVTDTVFSTKNWLLKQRL